MPDTQHPDHGKLGAQQMAREAHLDDRCRRWADGAIFFKPSAIENPGLDALDLDHAKALSLVAHVNVWCDSDPMLGIAHVILRWPHLPVWMGFLDQRHRQRLEQASAAHGGIVAVVERPARLRAPFVAPLD